MKLTTRFPRNAELALFALLFLVFFYFFSFAVYDLGWYPREEGTYLEMAIRVGRGDLPHRDFEDSTTGGVHFFHSVVVEALSGWTGVQKWKEVTPGEFETVSETMGQSILSGRLVLLAVSALTSLVGLLVLRRCLSAAMSFLVIFVCAFWGPGSYLVPTPGWYGVLTALCGLYLLLRYSETRQIGWLFASGIAAGAGIFFHLGYGLLQVLAAVLFLFYLDSERSDAPGEVKQAGPAWGFKSAVLVSVQLLLLYFLAKERQLDLLAYFMLGPVALSAGWLYLEWGNPGSGARLRRLLGQLGIYAAAMVLTILPYLLPYLIRASLGPLWQEAVAGPFNALGKGIESPFEARDLLALAPANIFVLVLWVLHREKAPTWMIGLIVVSTAVGLFYALARCYEPASYRQTWSLFRLVLPEAVLVAAAILSLDAAGKVRWEGGTRRLLALAACFAGCFTWAQFPDVSGISFLYAFPFLLLLLAVLASGGITHLAEVTPQAARWFLTTAAVVWLAFFGLFAWAFVLNSDARHLAEEFVPRTHDDRLGLDRAPVFVTDEDCRIYEGIIRSVRVCSKPGDYVMAFPSCPEVFALSGRRNPFRTYQVPRKDELVYRAVVEAFEEQHVEVLVYNFRADVNRTLMKDAELMEYVRKRLPERSVYGDMVIYTAEEPWVLWAKRQPDYGAERARIKKRHWPWDPRIIIEPRFKSDSGIPLPPREEPGPVGSVIEKS
ncbi:MAG: hypothetical protein HYU36_05050 [Planctomycetes bacterium]|nr:hypothetical protein [Planctomycetota bacterium]